MTGLVYVAAFAPVAGLPAAAYATVPENAGELVNRLIAADPAAVGPVRIDTSDADRHDQLREAFYNDVDPDTAAAATALLSTDGPVGIPGETLTVTAQRYGAVKHAYVLCTRDNTIPVALQRRFVKEIDAVSAQPTTVAELDSSHSPFLSQPAALAEVICPP